MPAAQLGSGTAGSVEQHRGPEPAAEQHPEEHPAGRRRSPSQRYSRNDSAHGRVGAPGEHGDARDQDVAAPAATGSWSGTPRPRARPPTPTRPPGGRHGEGSLTPSAAPTAAGRPPRGAAPADRPATTGSIGPEPLRGLLARGQGGPRRGRRVVAAARRGRGRRGGAGRGTGRCLGAEALPARLLLGLSPGPLLRGLDAARPGGLRPGRPAPALVGVARRGGGRRAPAYGPRRRARGRRRRRRSASAPASGRACGVGLGDAATGDTGAVPGLVARVAVLPAPADEAAGRAPSASRCRRWSRSSCRTSRRTRTAPSRRRPAACSRTTPTPVAPLTRQTKPGCRCDVGQREPGPRHDRGPGGVRPLAGSQPIDVPPPSAPSSTTTVTPLPLAQ